MPRQKRFVMEMNDQYRILAKNTAWFAASSFGTKLLSFFLVPLYTSMLTTAEYGMADILATSASLLTYVFTLDMASAVLRFAMEARERPHRILSYGLRVLLTGSVLLAVFLLGLYFMGAIPWAPYCYFFLFSQFFALALHEILTQYLRATDRIKEAAVSGILLTAVTAGLNVALLLGFRMGLPGYLLAVSGGALVSAGFCLWAIRQPLGRLLWDCCSGPARREMRRYSIPLIFNGVAWGLNHSLDKYIVIWLRGAAESGVLSVAYKIPTLLTALHGVFAQAWNLSAVKAFDDEDRDGFFANTYASYNGFLVTGCSILVLLNIPLARFLFAKEFFAAWQYSSVLLLSSLFGALSGVLGGIFTAVKNSRVLAVSTVTAVMINAVLNVILVRCCGAMGAAVATAVSFFVVWLIRLVCTGKYIRWKLAVGKDIVAYLLVVAQIILEHLPGHGYIGQLAVLVAIVLIYRRQLLNILRFLRRLRP